MTRLACGREARCVMHRIRRAVEIGDMTLITTRINKLVVAARMTVLARHTDVGTGQRELRCAVVKRCGLPRCSTVTCLTVLAEIACNVIRIGRTGKICGVTLIAV